MSSRIKLLPDSVANQIAAGEVVNRPASVVKELMENAVDAGASNVTVNFRDGGRELIQIRDDGMGMSPQDARMAFERHATSKIASADDIYALKTFGFRGEALASIAAVSQVELATRQADSELGTRLNIDGGTFAGQSADAVAKGTQIWVRNLFYNLPARKKFLDRVSTETNHIITEFQRVALAHPEVAFQLFRDDAPLYNLPAGGLHQRVVGVMGRGSAAKLLEVGVDTSIARVRGYAGRPAAAKRRGREQFLFVNGRFFKSVFFHKAIIQAYDNLIPTSIQPPYFIFLEIDPEQIDVNVHPQKTEVKFTNQSAVWQIINSAVKETLAKSGAVPMMDFESDDRLEIPVLGTPPAGDFGLRGRPTGDGFDSLMHEPAVVRQTGYNPFTKYDAPHMGGSWTDPENRYADSANRLGGSPKTWVDPSGTWFDAQQTSHDAPMVCDSAAVSGAEERATEYGATAFDYISSVDGSGALQSEIVEFAEPKKFSRAVPIADGYAAALYGGVFVVVDLARAREAVLFERFRAMLRGGHRATQQLLFPERMAFSVEDAELVRDYAAEFAAVGFDIRSAGESAVEIVGMPADLPPGGLEEAIYGMLDALRDGVFEGEEERRGRLAAVMARSGTKCGRSMKMSPQHPSEAGFESVGLAEPSTGTAAGAAARPAAETATGTAAERVAGTPSTSRPEEETTALLAALAEVENSSFTPWGKPVMAEIGMDEIRTRLR